MEELSQECQHVSDSATCINNEINVQFSLANSDYFRILPILACVLY